MILHHGCGLKFIYFTGNVFELRKMRLLQLALMLRAREIVDSCKVSPACFKPGLETTKKIYSLVSLVSLGSPTAARRKLQRWIEEPARCQTYSQVVARRVSHNASSQSKLSLLVFGNEHLCKETSVPLRERRLGYKPVDRTAPPRQCGLPLSLMGTRSVTTIGLREAKYVGHECEILDYVFERRTF